MKPQDLLPCPFCKGVPEPVQGMGGPCAQHPLNFGDCPLAGMTYLAEVWNKRSPAVDFQHDGEQSLTIQEVREEIAARMSRFDIVAGSHERMACADTAYRALEHLEDWIAERVQEAPGSVIPEGASGGAKDGEGGAEAARLTARVERHKIQATAEGG